MKANKIITTALLSSLVLGAFAAVTQETSAAPIVVPGNGNIVITEGELVPGEDEKDPEIPEDPIITDEDEVKPGPSGEITILGVSNLKFGSLKKGLNAVRKPAAATTVKLATADPATGTLTPTGVTKQVGNYIQFGDIRSDEFGYDLQVEMKTQFTSATNKTLDGASISYTNGVLTHADAKLAGYTHPNLLANASTFELKPGIPQQIIDFNSTEGGKGIYSIEYGQTDNYDESKYTVGAETAALGTEANSVFLNIPKSTAINMAVTAYTAEVEWTLVPH